MSADNWTVCPKCADTRSKQARETAEKLKEKYGKISQEEFLAESHKLKAADEKPSDKTLREDYEIGMDSEGCFQIDYQCSCKCGFKFSFKRESIAPLG